MAKYLTALVTPAGLEPATNSLEGCCSIRLSYGAEGIFRQSATAVRTSSTVARMKRSVIRGSFPGLRGAMRRSIRATPAQAWR